ISNGGVFGSLLSTPILNAPQTAREWVASNIPENQDATGKFPQVDITLETTNFANRLQSIRRHRSQSHRNSQEQLAKSRN
ncbi:MAG: hypothetical protein EBY38_02900, partial [Flavobacteriaceae bacterium]|nr:hypothetical protein [Flavobacteriaceae bacterium]